MFAAKINKTSNIFFFLEYIEHDGRKTTTTYNPSEGWPEQLQSEIAESHKSNQCCS